MKIIRMETKGNEYLHRLARKNPKLKTMKFLLFDIAAKLTISDRQLKAWISVIDKEWFNTIHSWWNACFGFSLYYFPLFCTKKMRILVYVKIEENIFLIS